MQGANRDAAAAAVAAAAYRGMLKPKDNYWTDLSVGGKVFKPDRKPPSTVMSTTPTKWELGEMMARMMKEKRTTQPEKLLNCCLEISLKPIKTPKIQDSLTCKRTQQERRTHCTLPDLPTPALPKTASFTSGLLAMTAAATRWSSASQSVNSKVSHSSSSAWGNREQLMHYNEFLTTRFACISIWVKDFPFCWQCFLKIVLLLARLMTGFYNTQFVSHGDLSVSSNRLHLH